MSGEKEDNMKLGLEGRSFLVLVSSQGLGKGIAGELAAQGARVMISSRNEAALQKTIRELRSTTDVRNALSPLRPN